MVQSSTYTTSKFSDLVTYGVGGGEELPLSELNGPGSKSEFCHFIAVWL